ncbi:MAG: AraC family transcriptional regulator, partial [Xanthobacteraceae bacterium]
MSEGDDVAHCGRHPLPASIVRALDWLGTRLDEPVRLDTLATVAGVRPRTLQLHFKAHLGTTPLGWVRRTRLARARQQLLAGRDESDITGVAIANGFSQLGRFAARYRNQFGELPSQTLARTRAPPLASSDIDDEALRL